MGARTVGEIFSGAGGIALGAKQAGWRTLWAVDNDQWACKTFERNLGLKPICGDARAVDWGALPKVGCIAFGFPCVSFSTAGRRDGLEGEQGRLYECGIAALQALQPDYAIAENVLGIRNIPGELDIVASAMRGAGYRVEVAELDAAHYGVPQHRHRMIFLGVRKDLPAGIGHPQRHAAASGPEALAGIPPNAPNHEVPPVRDEFAAVPPGGAGWKYGLTKFRASLKRMPNDGPARTVTASDSTIHWREHRLLSNRERARLQSFPDDFAFSGSPASVRQQIGNALPPKTAEAIFRRLP